MNKALVIASRDYSAAVKSKSFLVGLFLLPIMMFGGLIMQRLTKDIVDVVEKKVVIIDRTPGAELADALMSASREARNETKVNDAATGRQTAAKFSFETIEPAPVTDQAAVDRQRMELSERIKSNDLFAFIEIGGEILEPKRSESATTTPSASRVRETASSLDIDARIDAAARALGDPSIVRYTTNRPTYGTLRSFIQETIGVNVQRRRAEKAGLNPLAVAEIARPPIVNTEPLYSRGADGTIRAERKQGQIESFLIPLSMMLLMFLVVMIGASPLATNVVEEKQLRIAEVLLGSLNPFQLMLGKLLGGVGVALTLAAVYLLGGYFSAREMGMARYLTPQTLMWFVLFTILSTMLFGSLFVAAGAAVTNIKEAQTLITPVMFLVMLPLFAFGPILTNPSGPIAVAGTLIPFSAPLVTVMRLGIPPGVPGWQIGAAIASTLIATLVVIWAAGRIFRVGILMQGQAANFAQLMKWVVRG